MSKPNTTITPLSQAIVLLVGLLLLIPSVMALTSDEKELSIKHSRALEEFPSYSMLQGEPVSFFDDFRSWYADRVGFGTDASMVYRKLSYYAFRDSGAPNALVGKNSSVFLTAHNASDASDFGSIKASCPAQSTWPKRQKRMISDWQTIQDKFNAAGIKVSLLIYPSKKTLYPELLPYQIPSDLLERCATFRDSYNPLKVLQEEFPDSVFDAYKTLAEHKATPNFYPLQNFHPDGESVVRGVDAFVSFVGYEAEIDKLRSQEFVPKTTNADMVSVMGFDRRVAVNTPADFDAAAVREDDGFRERFLEKADDTSAVKRFVNENAPIQKRVLLITNSFGNRPAPYFSKYFSDVEFIQTNRYRSEQKNRDFFENYALVSGHDHAFFILEDQAVMGYRLHLFKKSITPVGN
ncbi:MAG: hypothetical protein AAGI14_08115 [Pseudomonadota bacterium]